ncbi:putative inositol-tetrakisphosphate 1-kinase [Apostichopus japonicus]|uniref:Inositol-tetrakisphosphate 1-kinase n=1 Tax=Stichopus japonicus TaxID=307972 RepID=A0A2G8LIP4_STIJA|nr:putative inositol-tetrakisphosphate 1-kinase [Apostichopus japonicus]
MQINVDLLQSLEDQGPYDLIIHKLTDVITRAQDGDNKAKQMMSNLQEYVRKHPHVIVLDPINAVRKLMDRHQSYQIIQDCIRRNKELKGKVAVPRFFEIKSSSISTQKAAAALKCAQVSFPCVCKPSQAHGSVTSHKMAIIFNEAGLKDVVAPYVAQTFISHNAVLYKLFFIGDQYFTVQRPSLKNFTAGEHSTIFFDSHDVSKPNSSSFLNELDEKDLNRRAIEPESDTLNRLAKVLRIELGMALFGVDVIVENNSGIHYIIDINAFPGYDGVPEFRQALFNHVQQELSKVTNSILPLNSENNCPSSEDESSPKEASIKEILSYDLTEKELCKDGQLRQLKRSLSSSSDTLSDHLRNGQKTRRNSSKNELQ